MMSFLNKNKETLEERYWSSLFQYVLYDKFFQNKILINPFNAGTAKMVKMTNLWQSSLEDLQCCKLLEIWTMFINIQSL